MAQVGAAPNVLKESGAFGFNGCHDVLDALPILLGSTYSDVTINKYGGN